MKYFGYALLIIFAGSSTLSAMLLPAIFRAGVTTPSRINIEIPSRSVSSAPLSTQKNTNGCCMINQSQLLELQKKIKLTQKKVNNAENQSSISSVAVSLSAVSVFSAIGMDTLSQKYNLGLPLHFPLPEVLFFGALSGWYWITQEIRKQFHGNKLHQLEKEYAARAHENKSADE